MLLMLVLLFGRLKTLPWVEGMIPFVMALIVYGVAQFQIAGITRRLDALIELLEPELLSQKASAGHEEAEQDAAHEPPPPVSGSSAPVDRTLDSLPPTGSSGGR